MSDWFWGGVAVVGAAGACGRFLLDAVIAERATHDFPIGTLTINATGSLLLGLLTGLALSGDLLLLLGTATIGSYTTFSTWMLETHRLAEEGEIPAAIINVLLSLAVGVGAAALGRTIGAQL
ncbi:MAG TPA: fluoride efflux transporter CrcB [Solirubrobacteraceae bacterium]